MRHKLTPKSVEPLDREALEAFLDNQIKNVEDTIIEDYSFSTFGFTDIFKNGFQLTNGFKTVNVEIISSEDNYLTLSHNKYLDIVEKWDPKKLDKSYKDDESIDLLNDVTRNDDYTKFYRETDAENIMTYNEPEQE